MYAVGKIGNYITRGVVSVAAPFHPFGGAVDIVVVEQEDGSFKSSPWYVQFGKFQGVLKAREKVVIINVNGVDAEFGMYLDSRGGAYFLREADGEDGMSEGSWGSSAGGLSSLRRPKKIMSCNYDLERSKLVSEFEAGNAKFVTRSTSNGPRILGFVFGKESENEKASQQQEDVGGRDREGSLESAEIAADLLEVRWSTSLATRKQKKDSSVRGGNKTPKLPHSNGFHDNSSRTNSVNAEGDTEIPLSTSPMTFMESFTLQEKHFEANGVSNSSVSSNVGDAGIIRNGEGAHRSDASRSSNSSSFVEQSEGLKSDAGGFSSGDKNSSALQFVQADDGSKVKIVQSGVDGSKLREITSEIKPGLSSNILACEVANNIGNPFLTNDGSKSIAVTPVDSATVLETKVEVILDCKTDDGPVKYVEEMVVDQVCANQDPSLTTALLIEETTSAALNLMENLKLEKHCSSPHSDVIPPRSCENHDSLVTTGPGSENPEGEQLLSSDLESLERKIAQTTNFSDVDDCGERSDERVGGLPGKLDEAQFVFSDVDGSEAPRTMDTEPTPLLSVEAESNPKKYSGSSEEKLDDEMLKKSRSFTGELIQEVLPNDHPSSPEISRTTSSPVSIARAREQAGQIAPVDLLSSSWSHGVEINSQDVDHPVSRSLDSSFDNMMLVQADVPAISENGTQEQQTTLKKSSLEQHQISKELKELLSDPAVEISLSGHLVHQGMGYEAAASAFDAEKVDAKEFISLGSDVMKNDKVVVRIGGLYFPWDEALPIISAIGAPRGKQILEPKGMILVDHVDHDVETDLKQSTDSSNGTWKLWRSKKTKTMSRNSSVVSDTGSQRGLAGNADTLTSETMKKNVVRAKTPTSDQLESLNLKEGKNIVTFTFSTPMLGEQKVDAQIYLWKWNARIVISDVDGTITKSDVLGQFMPMVGVDWSQTGVTHLFSAIKENGYELLFLSARAISQASLTRQFLSNLKQDGKALPEGPVVISPDGLFPSLFREVIRRAPHEFKIACLEDIKALFPLDHNPFYAGFGNRDTDEISYVKVGIPIGKVFIINPKGEVAVHRRVDTKSYTVLHDLVNEMFPHPICAPPDEKEDYNTWNFWRLPPPDAL